MQSVPPFEFAEEAMPMRLGNIADISGYRRAGGVMRRVWRSPWTTNYMVRVWAADYPIDGHSMYCERKDPKAKSCRWD